jgi:hypothetical protein
MARARTFRAFQFTPTSCRCSLSALPGRVYKTEIETRVLDSINHFHSTNFPSSIRCRIDASPSAHDAMD